MDVVYERCAALDLAKRSLVACLRLPRQQQVRTFSTVTDDLLEMADWLRVHGVTHVAMEATGSLWKPVYNLLWRLRLRAPTGEPARLQGRARSLWPT